MEPAIDPTAWLAPGVVVLGDVTLGKQASLWYGTVVRGDTERIVIGEETNIQDLSMVHADPGVPCLIGRRVSAGHRVILHGCTVDDDCLIGMGAILLNGVKVGAGSIVGAGTVLPEGKEIPPRLARGGRAGPRPPTRRRRGPDAHGTHLAALRRAGPAAPRRGVPVARDRSGVNVSRSRLTSIACQDRGRPLECRS
jgi:carbonic anhydrase/acetyltransferase-like protein (isoleucine patch superfamily)